MLVIEDSVDIRNSLKRFFKEDYFAVDAVGTGQEGIQLARINSYDIILLDCMLPDMDGTTVCASLRQVGVTSPVLVISGIFDIENKLRLFDMGADDYVVKPFKILEVRSRVKALLRRPRAIIPDMFTTGSLTVDFKRREVFVSDSKISLTRKEFSLLEYLIKNQDRTVSKSELVDHVWDMDINILSNTIETHIFNLRKKISVSNKSFIQTVSGSGYIFGM